MVRKPDLVFRWELLALIGAVLFFGRFCQGAFPQEIVFPGKTWDRKSPDELGLKKDSLIQLSQDLGGRGCVIKNGYIVASWGDQGKVADWLSSAKPVLTTLLFFAIEEGKIRSVDQRIGEFGWNLLPKDAGMSFRHLANMTSGYARPEPPGEAWAYNDYAIQLYQRTLFDRVFQEDPKRVAESPKRLGALGFEDGLFFDEQRRRLATSVRDFARIAWFWLNRGRWKNKQVLPEHYFTDYMKPHVPGDLPHTAKAPTNDYLGIGSYGGGSDHFTNYGPGIYGFNWWFNSTGRLHPNRITWPDAPPDTVMSIGAGGNCSVLIPSRNLVLVSASGNWGPIEGGKRTSRMNRILRILAEAATGSR